MSFSNENFVIVSRGGSGQSTPAVGDQVSADEPRFPRWFLPGFFDGVEDDEVDTTLRLCPPGTFTRRQKPKKLKEIQISRLEDDEKEKMKMKMKKKRSRWEDAEASTPSRDGGGSGTDDESLQKRRHVTDGEDQRALVPTEPGIGGVMQAALLRGGSRPVLLHKKKLDECDMNNMLFVKGGERVAEFLREVDGGGKGATVMGVDGGGRVYEKLVMKNWASLKMVVINSDWNKVIKANKAQIGQIMEIWGYTENHKPCLAFNFRVDRLESDHDRSSTTTTTT